MILAKDTLTVCLAVPALFYLAAFQSAAVPKPQKGGSPELAKIKNPVAATPDSIAAGKRAYQRLCVKCHGPEGKGDGTAATGAQPSDLTGAKTVYGSTDGDLFAVIRRGRASVVTDRIETVTESGIALASGRQLAADVIVMATGLKARFVERPSLLDTLHRQARCQNGHAELAAFGKGAG